MSTAISGVYPTAYHIDILTKPPPSDIPGRPVVYSELGMDMALPPSLPTLRASRTKNLTRPDNVFCSAELAASLRSCTTAPHLRPAKTDHFPVLTVLDLPLDTSLRPQRERHAPQHSTSQQKRLSLALDSALQAIADVDPEDDIIVAPRSSPRNVPTAEVSEHRRFAVSRRAKSPAS